MNSMLRTPFLLVLLVLGSAGMALQDSPTAEPTKAADEKWISLFNGKDLDGWTVKIRGYEAGENFGDTFQVKDGVLRVVYDAYENFDSRFGHLFYKDSYSHYRLRAEYRFVGDQVPGGPGWAFRNSGFMLHGQSVASMTKDQSFPVSIEVQLLGGNGTDRRSTGNLCTPGTHVEMKGKLEKRHCINSSSETYHGDQWVKVEVEVRGSEVVRHSINGEVVLEYQNPQLDPNDGDAKKLIQGEELLLDRGSISLQAESHPVEFRNIELLNLEK